jgi:hypothetical protein
VIITEIAIAVVSGLTLWGISAIFKVVVHIEARIDRINERLTRLETMCQITP